MVLMMPAATRRRGRRLPMRPPWVVLVPAFVALAGGAVACFQDFATFELPLANDTADASSKADGPSESPPQDASSDAPATCVSAPGSCLGPRTTCRSSCDGSSASCLGKCTDGGAKCQQDCKDSTSQCNGKCNFDCITCSGACTTGCL
jgi:hypothetical protein